jgi:hypothetical protein
LTNEVQFTTTLILYYVCFNKQLLHQFATAIYYYLNFARLSI